MTRGPTAPYNTVTRLGLVYIEEGRTTTIAKQIVLLRCGHMFTPDGGEVLYGLTCTNDPTSRPRRCLRWHPMQRWFLKGFLSPLVWTRFHLSHSVSTWVLHENPTGRGLCLGFFVYVSWSRFSRARRQVRYRLVVYIACTVDKGRSGRRHPDLHPEVSRRPLLAILQPRKHLSERETRHY